jgi:serine/threonine protein kinase
MRETAGAADNRASSRLGAEVDGKYRLEVLLGVGGTAAVYAARHRNGHRVALKMLHPELAGVPGMRQRFLREAYVANSLAHEGIVPILDDSVAMDGSVYLVMELLDGESLGALARRRGSPLTVPQVLAIAIAVLDVLAIAHDAGIVHRDIKPENIFLCRDGRVRLLDFGIARHVIATEAMATAAGTLLGTPAFMAPEQAMGRSQEVGPRTDIWAVGATMWNLLTGKLVHEGRSAEEVLVYAATREARPLAAFAQGIDPRVAALVDRALSFESSARWTDAVTMRATTAELCSDVGAAIAPLVAALPASRPSELPPAGSSLRQPTEAKQSARIEVDATVGPRLYAAVPTTSEPTATRTLNIETASSRSWTPPKKVVMWTMSVIAFLTAAALPIAWKHRGALRAATPAVAPDKSPSVSSTVPGSGTGPTAPLLLREAQQSFKDASWESARSKALEATTRDPSCASAHLLYFVLSQRNEDETRKHYRTAERLRDGLSPIELDLLHAYEPAARVPADLEETRSRLERLTQMPNADPMILAYLAKETLHLGQYEKGRAISDALSRRPEMAAVGSLLRARAAFHLGHAGDARDAYNSCLSASPAATSCLGELIDLEADEGRCETSVNLSRRLISIDSDRYEGFIDLARALLGTGEKGITPDVREALSQALQRTPGESRRVMGYNNDYNIAAAQGDFDHAEAAAHGISMTLENDTDQLSHAFEARLTIDVFLEVRNIDAARATALSFLQKRAAWQPSDDWDRSIWILNRLRLAGGMTENDYEKERETWIQKSRESRPTEAEPLRAWLQAYPGATTNEAQARVALRALPAPDAVGGPESMSTPDAFYVGKWYAALHMQSAAVRFLRHVTQSCQALTHPIEHTQAFLALGRVLASSGDAAAACKSYRGVADRWGGSGQSATLQEARNAAAEMRCAN